MNSHAQNRPAKLTHFAMALTLLLALVALPALEVNSQQFLKGISVHLTPTMNATPALAADDANAWIVSVGADGRLWFGATPVTPQNLVDAMIRTPRNRVQHLYIKADARAPYSYVLKALQAGHVVAFGSAIFLTAQPTSPQPNGLVPPMGLQVWIESATPDAPSPIDIEVVHRQASSTARVNNQDVSWADLPGMIKELVQGQSGSVVRLSAPGDVPFGDVARAIDASHGAGARVVIAMPQI